MATGINPVALIPAPWEVVELAKKVLGNHISWDNIVGCLTDNQDSIAKAGAAAIPVDRCGPQNLDEHKLMAELDQRYDTPVGFTQFDSELVHGWGAHRTAEAASVCDLYGWHVVGQGASYTGLTVVVKRPRLRASPTTTLNDILVQARLVGKAGIEVSRDTMVALGYDRHDTKPTLLKDYPGYVMRSVENYSVVVYNPAAAKALQTRRSKAKKALRPSASQSFNKILSVFVDVCWKGLEMNRVAYLAAPWSGTLYKRGLYIKCFVGIAAQVGRTKECRKKYVDALRNCWFHRNLIESNCSESFVSWFKAEIVILGKPKGAAEQERKEALKKQRAEARLHRRAELLRSTTAA